MTLLIALASVACSTPGASERIEKSRKNSQIIRELREEKQLGRGIAAGIIQEVGIDQKLPENARLSVKTIGQALAQEFGRPQAEHFFEILDSDEANAYATPGGFIFITRGLLQNIESLDELIEVLGHELAHVNDQHVYKILRSEKKSASGLFILARLLGGGSGDIGVALGQAVQKGVELLLRDGMDPSLEKSADESGISYAASLGFDPDALARLVRRIDHGETQRGSHLSGEERVQWLNSRSRELQLSQLAKEIAKQIPAPVHSHRKKRFKELKDSLPVSKTELKPPSSG